MAAIKETFRADFCTEENTAKTIRDTFETYSYLIDTHTACALYASLRAEKENEKEGRDVKILTASTASPYKFSADVLRSLGENIETEGFEAMYALHDRTGVEIPAPLAALRTASVRFTNVCGKDKDSMLKEALAHA